MWCINMTGGMISKFKLWHGALPGLVEMSTNTVISRGGCPCITRVVNPRLEGLKKLCLSCQNHITWDQALFSFRFVNNIPAGMAKRKDSLIQTYGGEYWTKMELNKFISNRVMHYIVPCGDIPSKTTNFSVDRYTIPDTSCYCIGHAPTSYRMLLYRAWCCQIVINVRR